eukprot:m.276000 g.276000  ORF g.276000 m.276000 type:complete len:188 (-) comp15704_c0_seq2:8614-9177(-)
MASSPKFLGVEMEMPPLSPQPARVGREKQRYEDGKRLVVGGVPYRVSSNGLEVLLISSSKKPEWIIPKGGWETDETAEEAARREAYEEAGVEGAVGKLLYSCEYEGKKKMLQLHRYYALSVARQLDDFPEADKRSRQWCLIQNAREICTRHGMAGALEAIETLYNEGNLPCTSLLSADQHQVSQQLV